MKGCVSSCQDKLLVQTSPKDEALLPDNKHQIRMTTICSDFEAKHWNPNPDLV